ncbi:TPA: glycosyltransferase [Streptococcus suis]
MALTIYTAVVIYNSSLNESETCRNLISIKNHNIKIIIFDNSDIVNNNKDMAIQNNWIYLTEGKNVGLSRAYNIILDYLKQTNVSNNDLIVWFDDDSKVNQEYFDCLEEAATNSDAKIFAPMIQGQDGKFWSPNYARFFKNKQLKSVTEAIPDSKFNAINSCTAVKLSVYDEFRYDERIFLDQVDHSFFEQQREKRAQFKKLDVIIQHNFSTKSKMNSIDSLKKRYSIMIPDFLTFASRKKTSLFLGYIKVLAWGVKESIKYKNINFFFWTIGKIFSWILTERGR